MIETLTRELDSKKEIEEKIKQELELSKKKNAEILLLKRHLAQAENIAAKKEKIEAKEKNKDETVVVSFLEEKRVMEVTNFLKVALVVMLYVYTLFIFVTFRGNSMNFSYMFLQAEIAKLQEVRRQCDGSLKAHQHRISQLEKRSVNK